MSLVNTAQMIEKELQRLGPHTFWRYKNIRKCEIERSPIFGNSLTGTEKEPLLHEKQSEIDSEDRDFFDNIKKDQHIFENPEDDIDIIIVYYYKNGTLCNNILRNIFVQKFFSAHT